MQSMKTMKLIKGGTVQTSVGLYVIIINMAMAACYGGCQDLATSNHMVDLECRSTWMLVTHVTVMIVYGLEQFPVLRYRNSICFCIRWHWNATLCSPHVVVVHLVLDVYRNKSLSLPPNVSGRLGPRGHSASAIHSSSTRPMTSWDLLWPRDSTSRYQKQMFNVSIVHRLVTLVLRSRFRMDVDELGCA